MTRGHQSYGMFVELAHECPGWKTCAVRKQIDRDEKSRRLKFMASLRVKSPADVLKLGATTGSVISIPDRPNSEEAEPSLPPTGELYFTRPSSNKLTTKADSR